MSEGTAMLIRREEYTAPAFWIKTVDLTFDLDPAKTLVINKMTLEPNPGMPGAALRLDGEDHEPDPCVGGRRAGVVPQ
jgi:aminopeptidase N